MHLVMGLARWLALNNQLNLDHALEKQKLNYEHPTLYISN